MCMLGVSAFLFGLLLRLHQFVESAGVFTILSLDADLPVGVHFVRHLIMIEMPVLVLVVVRIAMGLIVLYIKAVLVISLSVK